MEQATTRTIRIGAATIGLLGLDQALNKATAAGMTEEQAVAFLFDRIKRANYIPPGRQEAYRQALRDTLRRHLQQQDQEHPNLQVRIYGPGCVSCNGLQQLVIEVLDRLQIAADIEQIHDPDEIGRAGILQTPALMINGALKSSGLLPTAALVEQWLQEAAASLARD